MNIFRVRQQWRWRGRCRNFIDTYLQNGIFVRDLPVIINYKRDLGLLLNETVLGERGGASLITFSLLGIPTYKEILFNGTQAMSLPSITSILMRSCDPQ